jgi:hypothetical protein
MLYFELVKKTYHEAVMLNQKIPSDLKTALKSHEKIPLFFKSISQELEKAQNERLAKNQKPFHEKTIKDFIYDVTEIFIVGIKAEADARAQSEIERLASKAEADRKKDLEATISGKAQGDYADVLKEGGVIMPEDRSIV